MSGYINVITGTPVSAEPEQVQRTKAAPKRASRPSSKGLGCQDCPLHKADGVRKVKNLEYVTDDRSIFVWGIAPGAVENRERVEFRGPAGQLLWKTLKPFKITRKDVNVQNVVRCWPTTTTGGRIADRPPTLAEIKCCSLYTMQALEKAQATTAVHLVFGQVAAKALLKGEYRKDRPIFWSEKLNAKVYALDHPSYFLRGGSQTRLREWHMRIAEAVNSAKRKGRYAYLEQQDYKLVRTAKAARRVVRRARTAGRAGKPVAFDIEYGYVDKSGKPCPADMPGARRVILVVGVSWAKGLARTFVIDHPEVWGSPERNGIVAALKSLLEDSRIQFVAHHGTADEKPLRQELDIRITSYDFDTNYSTYLAWPQLKKYGLDHLSVVRIPEFAGYKEIISQHLSQPANFATIPLAVMRLYNGADCDVTLRLQHLTKQWDGPLLRTYRDVAYILDDMQTRGPYFDQVYYDRVVKERVPNRLKVVTKQIRKIAGRKDFNPNAPQQIAEVVYDRLGFVAPEGYSDRSTAAEVLRIYSQDKRDGLFPKLTIEYRELSRMEGTYLQNYLASAQLHGGQLRTIWWLTGTITGRLRSGGKDRGSEGIINFQNLHGEPMLQNLLISDPRWRRVRKHAKRTSDGFRVVALDPLRDLRTFLNFDYGQIEIRIAAELSGDPLLLAAVESGDIHSAVGHELTGWPIDKIKHDKETRTLVKNIHFGVLYGMSPKSLYEFLIGLGIKITRERVNELHARYFKRYRRVKMLVEHLREFAEKHHYVETMFGFRRPITTDPDEDGRTTFWGNQAINSPIQGTAHQLLLFAMATLKQKPKTYSRLSVPVMEVHDALSFYSTVDETKEAHEQGIHLLQRGVPEYIEKNFSRTLKVPLVAEAKSGFRLGSLVDYSGQSRRKFLSDWLKYDYDLEQKISAKWDLAA